jgi:hypothetical protein
MSREFGERVGVNKHVNLGFAGAIDAVMQVELGVALRATASGNVRHFFHPKAGHLLL